MLLIAVSIGGAMVGLQSGPPYARYISLGTLLHHRSLGGMLSSYVFGSRSPPLYAQSRLVFKVDRILSHG